MEYMMTMTIRTVVLYVLLFNIIHYGTCITKPTSIVFENNQFKNIVIAFHDSVPADTKLIDTLKNHINKASSYLLKATHNRAYFKEITLLLPSTWPDDPSYGTATTETLNLADVIITDTVRPTRSLPKTRSYSGCGTPGVHILMSLDFLTKPRAEPYYASPGKYFVHAFAQFRWGVFQEYAETGESLFYFSLTSGHPEAIRCVYYLRGLIQKNDANQTICYESLIDPHTGIYTPDCLWRPYPTRQRVKASIMDHQWISVIETFCDDNSTNYLTVHNYEAPSKHNRLCGHRSTWDIISHSPDFNNGINSAAHNLSSSDLQVNFKIIKAKARRRRAVVVVDDQIKKNNLQISEIIDRLHHEIKVHDIEVVVKSQDDYMKEKNLSSNHDHVIHIKHSYNEQSKGTKGSLIITRDGSCYLPTNRANHRVEGNMAGHTLPDRLRETILMDDISSNNYIIINRDDLTVEPGKACDERINIDPTVGQKTVFVFYYEHATPTVTLHSPSGHNYDLHSEAYTLVQQNKVLQFYIETAEAGIWHYRIQSEAFQQISTLIATTPVHQPHDPVIVRTHVEVEPEMLTLYVDVTRGSHPVIGLNVTAKLETPTGQVETIQLLDNGAGADNSKHDGVYSRHFTRNITEGIYHMSAKVLGQEGDVFVAEETYETFDVLMNEDEMPLHTTITKRSLTGGLQRHVSMGSVAVVKTTLNSKFEHTANDTLSPSRVVDLKVSRHLYYRNTLVLTWTALGDDLDHGKVSKYEVFIGHNIKDVRALLQYGNKGSTYEGPGNITKETYKPNAMAMETEIYLWKMPPAIKTLSFSIRGVDEAGNSAEMSNVATFGFVQH